MGIRQGAMENLAVTRTARAAFWRLRRVLLTGHTGFKGSWLTLWLHRLGAKVTGIALPPLTEPNLYTEAKIEAHCESQFCDIRELSLWRPKMGSRRSGWTARSFPSCD